MTEQNQQQPTQGSPAADTPTPHAPNSEAASSSNSEDAFGSVGIAQAQDVKKGHRSAILIGLIIAALVAAGVVAYLFTSGAFNEPTPEAVQRVPLSEDRATAALEEAEMAAPDISQYAYVSQDDLIGPKFSDIKVQEPVDLGAPANTVVESTVTATATFKNKGIEINIPVTLPFDYSDDNETWVPGDLTQGDAVTKPLASAKASSIIEDRDEIMTAYDSTYGEEMAEAKVVKTKSDLSIEGGTITVDLSKTVEEEKDDQVINQLRTCTVKLKVAWDNNKGWQVTVSDAGQIERVDSEMSDPEAVARATKDEQTQGSVKSSTSKPVKLGEVKFGDKVNLSGTLRKVSNVKQLQKDNDYTNNDASKNADGNVQLVLEFTRPVTMTLGGKEYKLSCIAVAVAGLDDNGKSLINRKADVSGPLEEAFATSWSPAGIKALRIEVE